MSERTLLDDAWKGFQDRNRGRGQWSGRAQSKQNAFLNTILDLMHWMAEESAKQKQHSACPKCGTPVLKIEVERHVSLPRAADTSINAPQIDAPEIRVDRAADGGGVA